MSYNKRVIIFFSTMIVTAAILVGFFVHFTMRELGTLSASSIPLPTLNTDDQNQLHDFLKGTANNPNPTPVPQSDGQQSSDTTATPAQQSDNTQNSIPQIPAKAMQQK